MTATLYGGRAPGLRCAVLVQLAGLAVSGPPVRADHLPASLPEVPAELEAVRDKLARYKDPVAAIHDGYFSTLGCVNYPDGGMGVHFVNTRLMGPEPDPSSPQILLYAPENGKLHLAAVEWFVPLATGVKERPSLFGKPFEGPMEGHEPLQPKELRHYDLHVWLFKDNPAGAFHHSDPSIDCAGKWPYVLDEEPPKEVPHK